ncbi:hypothetical protein ACWD6U_42800, partial [Streptomyces sp. NPDC005149]
MPGCNARPGSGAPDVIPALADLGAEITREAAAEPGITEGAVVRTGVEAGAAGLDRKVVGEGKSVS